MRVDSAAYQGYRIPPHYDSLVGKLIVHGRTRNECLMRLRRALDEFVVDGVETTLPLFRTLVRNPDIQNGQYDIHWLENFLKTAAWTIRQDEPYTTADADLIGANVDRPSGISRMRRDRIDITPEILLKAYAAGIFPMAEDADDPTLFWVEPRERGIIPLDRFHVCASASRARSGRTVSRSGSTRTSTP